jgi:hypothetical protein
LNVIPELTESAVTVMVETFVWVAVEILVIVIVDPLFWKLSEPANCVPFALEYWMSKGLPEGEPVPPAGAGTLITVRDELQ